MLLNKGESLMRLNASCEISVRNIGREGGCVALEITQGKSAGQDVTTLLLCGDRARELASVLLQHSAAGSLAEFGDPRTAPDSGQEVGAACAS